MAAATMGNSSCAALLSALLAAMTLLGAGSCASREPARHIEEAPPAEWYAQRHKDVMRDFYGYHERTRQYRHELALGQEFVTNEWWNGQILRRRARERMVIRNQEIERAFFRMQERQQVARSQRGMVDTRAQQEFLAAQLLTQQHLQIRAQQKEAARQDVLRGEGVRRQQQVRQLAQARSDQRRLANRPLAPVRGLPSSRQPVGSATGIRAGALGAPATGAAGGQGFFGGATAAGGFPAATGQTAPVPGNAP